jgi:transposase
MNNATIQYRNMPDAVRLASAESAVAMAQAGLKLSEIAKAFNTSIANVQSWIQRKNNGTLGKKLHTNKQKHIDYRKLPVAIRNAARSFAMIIGKSGVNPHEMATQFGTSETCVRRWLEENHQIEKPRGRKPIKSTNNQ